MNKSELMKLVGKEVIVYFKSSVIPDDTLQGKLEYGLKNRMPKCFHIDHVDFKSSYVRKAEVL